MGFHPSLFWRAIWSVEERHDVHFGVYRLRHFDRWEREVVPVDDPWRWNTFGAGPDGPSIILHFPGKYACHDAKVCSMMISQSLKSLGLYSCTLICSFQRLLIVCMGRSGSRRK